ncbi:MAG: putative Ig domain-containing protein [Cyanobacteria bacterium P01_D01_bin.56]
MTGFPDAAQDSSVVLPIDINPVPDFENTSAIGQNSTTLDPDPPLTAAVFPFTDVGDPRARVSVQEVDDISSEPDADDITGLSENTALLQSDVILDSQASITQVAALGDVLQMPGVSATQTSLRFEWSARDAFYNNEVGVYVMDDALGTVSGLKPGDAGYAKAVLTQAESHVLFFSGETAGAWAELDFEGGTQLGFYLVQNSSREAWLAENPENLAHNGPVAFFSVNNSNPDGFDHTQSSEISEDVWQFRWEDLLGGGDQDFNDVVFVVSRPGILVPGSGEQTVPSQITLKSTSAQFANEMGFFYVDDAKGRIGALTPGDTGYAVAALSPERSSVLFAQGQAPGTVALPEMAAGQYIGWYLIQNATTADFLTQNPENQSGQGPLAFFSYPGANPDDLSHVHFVGVNTMAWEDAQDRDSDDLIFGYQFEPAPKGIPGATPTISAGDISITEGDSDSRTAILHVELSAPSTEMVTVDFTTVDDSAFAGTDYEAVSGALRFAPGETVKEVSIAILGDFLREEDERFNLILKNPKGATLLGGAASISIVDNDVLGAISVSALLVNDTGISADDGVTSDPTIAGTVSDFAATKQLFANFIDGQPTDITDLMQPDGSFLLSQEKLQSINGGTLSDGEYQLQLQAIDLDDQASDVFTLPFLLDTTAPDGPNLTLASEYGANNETFHGKVTVDGQTEADVLVELQENESAVFSDGDGQLSFTNLTLEEGANQFAAIATDSAGNQSTGTVDIRKVPLPAVRNTAPVITSMPQSVFTLGLDDYRYQVEATDADNDPLTYSLVSGPAGMSIDSSTGLMTWSPGSDNLGEQTVSVIVSDDKGGTATQTFAITVVEAISNRAPEIISTPITTIDVTQNVVTYQYDVIATDPDGDTLIYSLLDAPVGMDIDPAIGVINWQPEEIVVGEEYSVTVQVSDGNGETDTQTFLLKAENQNQAPIFVSSPLTDFSIPLPASASGAVIPEFLNLSLGENETFFGSVSITLPEQGDLGGSADIVLVVDESGSMAGEHEWLTDMVLELDAALEARGITNNRYSLLGFAGTFNDPGVRNITLSAQPDIKLYGPGNQLIDSQAVPSTKIVLPGDGDYTVVLDANNYDLQVRLDNDAAAVIPNGFDTIFNQTIEANASQSFTFEAPAGLRVWFDSLSSTSRNIQGTLLSPTGDIVTALQSDSDVGPFSLPVSGTYTLIMRGGSDGGAYSFQFLNMSDAASITLDSPITLTVDPSVTQVFQVSGTALQQLYINSTSSSFRSRWTLYDSSNQPITSSEALSDDLAVILTDDGTYWLVIQSNDGEPVSHSFQIVTPQTQVTAIAFDEVVSNTITEAGETDIYQFEGQAGQGVWVDGLFAESLFGPNVRLFNPNGQRVLSTRADIDTGLITLSSAGTYSLVVGGGDIVGDYSFQILSLANASAIASGDIVFNSLSAERSDIYRLEGVAGQRLKFETISLNSQFFSNWKLYGPGHTQVLQNNRRVNNRLAEDFDAVLPVDGTYYLVLSNDGAQELAYSFQVTSSVEPSIIPAGFDITHSHTIAADTSDTYTFQASAGSRIWLDSLATDSSIRANLTDSSGNLVFSNIRLNFGGDPRPFVLETSGLYTLTVDGGTVGGEYSFQLLNFDDATPLSPETTTEVALAPFETQLYEFEGTAGSPLFFDLEESDSFFGPVWTIFAPGTGESQGLRINPDNDLRLTLPADGVYVLAPENISASTINLRFQVVTSETQVTSIGFNEVINGNLDNVGSIHQYTFTGSSGQTIWIDSLLDSSKEITARLISPTNNNLFDGSRRLISPSGVESSAADQPLNQDIGPVTLIEDGVYTLQIGGSDALGGYGFRLLDVTEFDLLADGDNFVGNLENTSETEFFRLENVTAGQTLTIAPIADAFFSDVTTLSQDTEKLSTVRGGAEDGYAGLNAALNLPFREDAATNLILVTDEARSNIVASLDFSAIQNEINEQDALFNAVLNAQFEDENETIALGINAKGDAYIADEAGGFILSQGGQFTGASSVPLGDIGAIKGDYVDLALAVGGANWDLNQLRAGGDIATSFTKAFVDLQADSISEKFQIDVAPTDNSIAFANLTGPVSGFGSGDTAEFDIAITGEGEPESFELLFTRPESGFVLGSMPVVLNQQYQYPALAVDPDGDSLTYSLLQGPDRATLDPATGAITWNPSAVGSYEFSIQASDGNGGVAVQDFVVEVNAINGDNQAPTITSTPSITEIDTRQTLAYDVDAVDPDGDTLSYYLNSGPPGVLIDQTTGELIWSPTNDQAGSYTIEILVLDGKGKQATQTFDVLVNAAEPNLSPRFNSVPLAVILTDETYQYQPIVTDPEGDVLTYSLRQQPNGMIIDETIGLVTWQPEEADLGQYDVVIVVADTEGNETQQSFQLTVSNEPFEDTLPPELTLAASSNLFTAGEVATLQIQAIDDVDLASISLELDGNPLTLIPNAITNGQIYTATTAPLSAPGIYIATGLATDGAGNTTSETFDLRVIDPLDTESPEIVIDISGLEVGVPISNPYDVVASITDSNLEFYRVEYAPTRLVDLENVAEPDPDYVLLSEGAALPKDDVLATLDPRFINNDTYFVRVTAQDFNGQRSIQGFVAGIATENKVGNFSLDATDLTIPLTGIPVTVSRRYDTLQANEQGTLGFGWDLVGVDAKISESVAVTDRDGIRLFTATPFTFGTRVTLTNPDGERVGFTFTPEASPGLLGAIWRPKFTPDPGVDDVLEVDDITLQQNGDGTFRLYAFGFAWNPREYRLTTKDNLTYTYDQFEGLQTVEDRNANVLTYTDDGIFSSTGDSVRFTYDDQDRITRITDPAGNSISYTYDDNGDLVGVTDPAGNTTHYVYDPERLHFLIEEIDPLGRSSVRTEYDDQGRINRIIDAEGNALDINIDFDGPTDTQVITDPLGNQTILTYDDQGNVIQQVDAEGGITRYEYSEDNRVTRILEPLGNSTGYTYDERGNLLTETDAFGNTTTYTYNEFNQILSTVDSRGNTTRNRYDAQGNLLEQEDAEGNITQYSYFADGNLRKVIDANNNSTNYSYDSFGRLTEVEDAVGAITRFAYDNVGNLSSITTPLGNTTAFGYDGEGQLVQITDAKGNITQIQYNAAGDRTAVIDALSRRTEYSYNSRGLETQVRYADGTVSQTVYDALDRVIGEIDQNGNETEFTYDSLDRLIAVTDALGNMTQYDYDANGNLIAQTDAIGHTTEFDYDALNRLIETELPLGQLETRTYDAVGNLASLTNFNGETITYEYDPNNLLSAVRLPDAPDETYTHTATGEIATITDARGTTQYTYDAVDQLLQRTDPDGTSIAYTYDLDGNITSLTTPSGTVAYGYDPLGFLETVTDRQNNTTTYRYDPVGNLLETHFGNGVVEMRTYDLLNRPIFMETTDSSGNLLSSYTYTLDNVGNRLTLEENTGRTVTYTYDDLYRLTQEAITDPANNDQTTNYVYDDVGNRLSGTSTTEGTTTYTYDENDRLLTEVLDGIVTEYSYDEAGNLITKAVDGDVEATYTWNSKGELIGALVNDGASNQAVSFQYNTDGLRVSQIVDGQVTHFLIDETQQEFAQVIEEYTPSGLVSVSYTHGNDLISQQRGNESFFYHTDGLGSTQLLTDADGNVVNNYVYDAYGQIISQNEATTNSYLFAGEQFDAALDSYYLRARYYQSEMGRFLSRDPFEGFQERPLSLNKYGYVEGNPINAIDPSGEVTLLERALFGTIAGIASVTYTVACRAGNGQPGPSTETILENFIGAAIVAAFVAPALTLGSLLTASGAAGLSIIAGPVCKIV